MFNPKGSKRRKTYSESEDESDESTEEQESNIDLIEAKSDKMAHIKMSPFDENHAAGWFIVLEAQFEVKSITQSPTKFYNALSHIPVDVAERLPERVRTSKDYEELKKSVIETFQKTKPELFEKLISDTKLTGRPSLYLQELNSIAKKVGVGEDLVKHRFIQALPMAIAPAIASQRDTPLEQLGRLADELMPFTKVAEMQVQAVTNAQEVNTVQGNISYKPRTTNNWDLTPFREGQRPRVCRSHIFYGNRSDRCKHWCQWPNKSNCRMQPNSRPASPVRSEPAEN